MKGKYYLRIPLVLLGMFCITVPLLQQGTLDYKKVFHADWVKAEVFLAENENWMRTECKIYDISYPFAVALIFPELIRYSSLRDRIEISLLKTLYINLGEEYADFSIGPFQMKPSFAEMVNKKSGIITDRKFRNQFRSKNDFKDLLLYRKTIVERLENTKDEFKYLIAFIKITDAGYQGNPDDEIYKLRYFATAYNSGFDKSQEYIKSMMDRKFFSTKLVKGESYSYSDIAIQWFKDYQKSELLPD